MSLKSENNSGLYGRSPISPGIIPIILISAFIAVLLNGIADNPAHAREIEFNDLCFRCHSNPNLEMTFPSGEVINCFIDRDEYEADSHAMEDISCDQCHIEIEGYPHPELTASTYREYKIDLNRECTRCHTDQLEINRDNVHITAMNSGSPDAPICSDCHGSHYVFPVDDPRSPVMGASLLETCRKCHPDATANFADSLVPHSPPTPTQWPLIYYIRLYYSILIPLVLGGIAFFGLFDYFRRRVDLRKGKKLVKPGVFIRYPAFFRFERWILGINFAILTITGLVHMNSDSTLPQLIVGGPGGIENVRTIHLVCGVIMMVQILLHVGIFYVRNIRMKRLFRILPKPIDARSAVHTFRYNVGAHPEKPKPCLYIFIMKIQHWEIVWGGLVIGITGLLLWNPIATTHTFPGQLIPAAKAAHGSEAVLAVLSIIVWYIYVLLIRRLK